MNNEIREQLKNYELTKELADEKFYHKKFKSGSTYSDLLYYFKDCLIEEYKLPELVDWIKTLLGTGINVHHPILHHINKEKAWKIVEEIGDIICENTSKFKEQKGNLQVKNTYKQKAKLILVDGREIEVEISEEELKKIEVKKSPYERFFAKKYFYIDDFGDIKYKYDDFSLSHTQRENNCNYYNEEEFANKCARADLLMRKLRKFAIEKNLKHERKNNFSYKIIYDKKTKIITCDTIYTSLADFNMILFNTSDDCKEATQIFHDELIWYFTEYTHIYE